MNTASKKFGFVPTLLAASALFSGCLKPPQEGVEWLAPAQTYDIKGGGMLVVPGEATTAGHYLVVVDQQGIDVALKVAAASSTKAAAPNAANLPTARYGTERLVFSANERQLFVITISSDEHHGHAGRVSVRIGRLPATTTSERLRREAELAMTKAATLLQDNQDEVRVAAEAELQKAEATFRKLGLRKEAVEAAYARAMLVLWPIGDNARAVTLLEKAAELLEDIGDEARSAHTLARAGSAQVEFAAELRAGGDSKKVQEAFKRAREFLETARQQQQRLGRQYDHAWTVNTIGMSYQYEGRFAEAHEHYAKALLQFEDLGDVRGEIMVRQNQAMADYETGQFGVARQRFKELQALAREKSDREQLMDVLTNAAIVYSVTGDLDEALRTYEEALALQRQTGDRRGEARSYNGMGGAYVRVGALDRALTLYQAALPIRRELKEARGLTATLTAMGDVYRQLGRIDEALASHREALRLADATSPHELGKAQLAIALDYAGLGQKPDLALALKDVLANDLPPEHPVRVRALEEQAVSLTPSDHPERALEPLKRAADSFVRAGSAADVSRVNYRAARMALDAGRRDEALRFVDDAIASVESIRGRIATPEIRAQYIADAHGPFELRVQLLLLGLENQDKRGGAAPGRGEVLEALLASDDARARFLIESLETSATRSSIGGSVREERDRLYGELAGLRYHQDRLLDKTRLNPREEAQLRSIPLKLERVRARLDAIEGRLNPAGVNTRPTQSGLARQFHGWQQHLAEDTRVLEYFLGDYSSAVWVIGKNSLDYHPLPERKSIEQQAKLLYKKLSQPPATERDDSWRKSASRLREWLLDPIAKSLSGRHVVVVPHRSLTGIPFEVLLATATESLSNAAPGTTRISYAASIRAAMSMDERAVQPPGGRLLAVVADPVFSASDERFAALNADPSRSPLVRVSAMTPESRELPRLPGTAREGRQIVGLAPKGAAVLLEGFSADRRQVLNANLGDFRILHFATHALADARDPQLSAIALSAFDREGRPESGMIRMHEIRNLRLRSDLVVLSGCESGLGKFYEGEGFVGLTHGFIAAGARQVVASLWRIPDDSTAALMTEFYRAMLLDERSPADALQIARAHTAAQGEWRHPFYWAPFVLIGTEKTTTRRSAAP